MMGSGEEEGAEKVRGLWSFLFCVAYKEHGGRESMRGCMSEADFWETEVDVSLCFFCSLFL